MNRNLLNLALASCVLFLASCASNTADHEAELKPLVDTYLAAWNTGNTDLLDGIVPDNFSRTAPGQNVKNRTELEAAVKGLRAAYPDMKVIADDVHYAKDRAFIHWTYTGTNTGPGDAPPTNKPVKSRGYTSLYFKNGRIFFEDVYFDALDWNTQLGAILARPGGDSATRLRPAVDMFITAWNTGDMEQLDMSTIANFKRTDPADNHANSREEMKSVMRGLRMAYPDAKVVITDSRYSPDRAYLNWTFSGTNPGPGDARATNKAVELNGYTIMHFDGDKIAHEEVYFDVLSWMTQLGATVTQPGG